ncbi:MAG: hypothetical protein ACK5LK_03515 [Chthoniobacterales bacterium]
MTSDLCMYSWDLSKFVPTAPELSQGFAWQDSRELEGCLPVIKKALLSDNSIYPTTDFFENYLAAMAGLFHSKDHSALSIYLTHGSRIIGASVLHCTTDAKIHLFSGPCILLEYRGRGLGGLLFQKSLATLANQGIQTVRGICTVRSNLQKYLYPKYGGRSEQVLEMADFIKPSTQKSKTSLVKRIALKKKSE